MSEKEDLSQTEPLSENLVRSCKIKNQLSNFIEWLRPPAAFCKCICRTNSIKARGISERFRYTYANYQGITAWYSAHLRTPSDKILSKIHYFIYTYTIYVRFTSAIG